MDESLMIEIYGLQRRDPLLKRLRMLRVLIESLGKIDADIAEDMINLGIQGMLDLDSLSPIPQILNNEWVFVYNRILDNDRADYIYSIFDNFFIIDANQNGYGAKFHSNKRYIFFYNLYVVGKVMKDFFLKHVE